MKIIDESTTPSFSSVGNYKLRGRQARHNGTVSAKTVLEAKLDYYRKKMEQGLDHKAQHGPVKIIMKDGKLL